MKVALLVISKSSFTAVILPWNEHIVTSMFLFYVAVHFELSILIFYAAL